MFVKLSTCNTQRDDEDTQTQIYRCISLIVTTVHRLCNSCQQKDNLHKDWEIQLTSDDIKSPREIAHEDKETARIITYLLQVMGFASVRKLRLTAITGGIWFTLLLQGRLATQTPSKHPGHKSELSLLHTNGWMWA